MTVPTAHNAAKAGDIAKTVLMPGDPLRAQFIAENFLEDISCYNDVRGMLGYTGYYKGQRISVQGHGMGIPSIGIYTYELFHFYDVDTIIRVGSSGAISEEVKIMDLIFAMGACTDSNYAEQYKLPGTYAPIASFPLLRRAVTIAEDMGQAYHVGNVLSSDYFYKDEGSALDWDKMRVLAVEMEAAALYMNAVRAGKSALTMLTVSDELHSGRQLPAKERQTSFTTMMQIALETALPN